MIVVKVELHSAVTGKVTELARCHIANIGGTETRRDYMVRTLRGRSSAALDMAVPNRTGTIQGHPSLALHVWHLVSKALLAVGYGAAVTVPREVAEAGQRNGELPL